METCCTVIAGTVQAYLALCVNHHFVLERLVNRQEGMWDRGICCLLQALCCVSFALQIELVPSSRDTSSSAPLHSQDMDCSWG